MFTRWKKSKDLISNQARSLAEKIGLPYLAFSKGTSYPVLEKAYQEALERGRKEGFCPVFVCVDATLEDYLDIMKEDGYTIQDALQADCEADDGKHLLEARFSEYYGEIDDETGPSWEEFVGAYEGNGEGLTRLTSIYDSSHRVSEILLVEVPTTNPWEIPAYIPFGGWNECPEPSQMVLVLKYWYQKYGAVPMALSHDTLELAVPSPVNEEDALQLAKEHYAFDPDRVDQCTASGTLSDVAECLKASTIWYFWWD